jgi:hypothetical protein
MSVLSFEVSSVLFVFRIVLSYISDRCQILYI